MKMPLNTERVLSRDAFSYDHQVPHTFHAITVQPTLYKQCIVVVSSPNKSFLFLETNVTLRCALYSPDFTSFN